MRAQSAAAVDLVGGHPAGSNLLITGPMEHRGGLLRLGRERQVVGDAGQLAAFVVAGPVPCQIQGPVDQRAPRSARVGEVDGDLAQADTAQRVGVLPRRPDRVGRGLLIPGLVDHQHRLLVGEMPHREGGQTCPYRLVVPHRPRQEVLQPVRTGVAQGLGQCPAVDPLQPHQHRLSHLPQCLPRLPARKAVRHHPHERPEPVPPHRLRYGGLHGHHVLIRLHKRS